MDAKSLLVGMVLGLALGWVVFGAIVDEAPVEAPEPGASAASARAPAPTLLGHPTPEGRPPGPPAPSLAEVFSQAGPVKLLAATEEADPPFPAAAVAALEARLSTAREGGDLRLYYAVVRALAKAGTPEADEILIRVVGDDGLSFPSPQTLAHLVYDSLEKSEQPGIADAARRRFERNLKDGRDSWVAAEGWLDLVARHGDLEDVHWLLARNESGQIRGKANESLGLVRDPEAVALVRDYLLEAAGMKARRLLPYYQRVLDRFVEHHRADGWEVARELMERALRSGEAPDNLDLTGLFSVLVDAGWPKHEPELRSILLSLTSLEHRVHALAAYRRLDREGADVSAYGRILEAPVEMVQALKLDDVHHGSLRGAARRAWRSFREVPALLTLENVELLEMTADRLGLPAGSNLREVPQRMRAMLASGWRTE